MRATAVVLGLCLVLSGPSLLFAGASISGKGSTWWHPDIPPVAMAAYQRAVDRLARTHPGCSMPWALPAAIGKVESDHGRFAGGDLDADGVATPAIVGPRLDGRPGVAAISDTDDGLLDGDTVWDRAVGPMQFIPSTWAVHGLDADDDGVANPQDIDDAASAAAGYLCAASGGDYLVASVLQAGVLAYNRSQSYVDRVAALMYRYLEEVVAVDSAGQVVDGVAVNGLVCPVAGSVSFIDSWGFPRPNGRTHKGQDLFAARGTPLVALVEAIVLEVRSGAGLGGKVVWLQDGQGAAWYYAHLDTFAAGLRAGDRLEQGSVLGTVGTTGNAAGTPPHLHIQWRPDGRRGADRNPYRQLDASCPGH